MRYADAAERMLADERLTHVVGCYTSSSRKEVLPFFEKYDGLLWYPSHYEGFESSEHVVYTGAAPNQHIVPLAKWLLTQCGDSAFFIGSNYIWAWENNKIMREAVMASGGNVLAERYLPLGETDFSGLIEQILAKNDDISDNARTLDFLAKTAADPNEVRHVSGRHGVIFDAPRESAAICRSWLDRFSYGRSCPF